MGIGKRLRRRLGRNAELRPVGRVSTFRRMAMGTWSEPRDPQIYGTMKVRMEESLRYIAAYRAATGRHLTVTHLVAKAVAHALAAVPEVNALIRLGRPQQREAVSVFFSIAMENAKTGELDLSGAKIDHVDRKTLSEVMGELETAARNVRSGKDPELEKSRSLFEKLPFGSARVALDLLSLGLYELNLDLRRFGLPKDPFASALVTNIGSLGLSEAYAPLMAYSRTPILLAVGAVQHVALVEDGQVRVGKQMGIHATLDHRLIDGKHAALLSRHMTQVLENPFDELDAIPTFAESVEHSP